MAATPATRCAIDAGIPGAGGPRGRRAGVRARARAGRGESGPASARACVRASVFLLALFLAASIRPVRAGHHPLRLPGCELVFNDREIVHIPRAYNPYESERDPANFFAFAALQNRAYQWVRTTQDSLGWRWHLCQVNPDEGEEIFRWPRDRDFMVLLEDGRRIRAVEIVAYETCHSIPREYEEARKIRVHPRGRPLYYDEFTTIFPESEAHVLLVAFELDAGTKWKIDRVLLAPRDEDPPSAR